MKKSIYGAGFTVGSIRVPGQAGQLLITRDKNRGHFPRYDYSDINQLTRPPKDLGRPFFPSGEHVCKTKDEVLEGLGFDYGARSQLKAKLAEWASAPDIIQFRKSVMQDLREIVPGDYLKRSEITRRAMQFYKATQGGRFNRRPGFEGQVLQKSAEDELAKAEQLSLFGPAEPAPAKKKPAKKKTTAKPKPIKRATIPKIKVPSGPGGRKKAVVGEIREWKGGRYQKQGDGSWKFLGDVVKQKAKVKHEKPKQKAKDPSRAVSGLVVSPDRGQGSTLKNNAIAEKGERRQETIEEHVKQATPHTDLIIEGKPDIKPPDKNPAIALAPDLWPDIRKENKLADGVVNFPNPAPLKDSAGKIKGYIEKLFPHQVEGAERIYQAWQDGDGAILQDDAGLGKQLPVDTLISTPSGWRKNGDLKVGDYVLGSDGSKTKVKGVFPQGIKPNYRVTFSDHSSVEAGGEHLWTVAYRAGGRRWQELVLTTDQLRNRDKIPMEWPSGRKTVLDLSKTDLYLPILSEPAQFDDQGPLPIPAYVMGQCLANGGLTHGTAELTTNVEDWDRIEKELIAFGGVSFGRVHTYGSAVHATLLGLIGRFKELDLDIGSSEKFIPDLYQRAKISDRIDLLHGLMNANGSISKERNRLVYHSTSERLAEGVRELVEGLGGIASVRVYDRTEEGKPIEFQVRIRLPQGILPFTIDRKAERYNPGRFSLPVRTVQSIEYTRDVESVCIAVESPDCLYATEHYILTHNTNIALAAMVAQGGKRNLIVVPTAGKEGLKAQWIGPTAGKLYNLDIKGAEVVTDKKGNDKLKHRYDQLSATEDGTYIVSYDELFIAAKDAEGNLIRNEKGKVEKRLRPELFDGNWDTVMFDESHNMTNPNTRASAAGKMLAAKSKKALYMSATPFTNVKDMQYLTKLNLFDPYKFNDRGMERTDEQAFISWAEQAGASVKKPRKNESLTYNHVKNPTSMIPMAAIAATMHVDGKSIKRSTSLDGVSSHFGVTDRKELEPIHRKAFDQVDAIIDFATEHGQVDPMISRALYIGWNRQYWETLKVDQAIALGKKAVADGKQVAFFTSFKASNHEHIRAIPRMVYKKAQRKMQNQKTLTEGRALLEVANRLNEMVEELPPGESAVQRLADAFGGPAKVAEIHGNTKKKPHVEQNEYQAGQKKVCVATMARGGTGISLHDTTGESPRVQINLSLPWSGREFNQVAGRSHRLGSKSDTEMHWLIGDDEHEEHNAAVVAKRLKSMGSLTTGDPEITVEATALADFDFGGGNDSDDAAAVIKQLEENLTIEQMAAEDTTARRKEKKEKGVEAKAEAEAARDWFREFGEKRKSGTDVIKERYDQAQVKKGKDAFLNARRAAEQLRQGAAWNVKWRPGLGAFEVEARLIDKRDRKYMLHGAVGAKGQTYGTNKTISYWVPPEGMAALAEKVKVHDRKIDLRNVADEQLDPTKRSSVEFMIDELAHLDLKVTETPAGDTFYVEGQTYAPFQRGVFRGIAQGGYVAGKYMYTIPKDNLPELVTRMGGSLTPEIAKEREAKAKENAEKQEKIKEKVAETVVQAEKQAQKEVVEERKEEPKAAREEQRKEEAKAAIQEEPKGPPAFLAHTSFPVLDGSPKQIKWAKDIREKALQAIAESPDQTRAEKAAQWLTTVESASTIIDNRTELGYFGNALSTNFDKFSLKDHFKKEAAHKELISNVGAEMPSLKGSPKQIKWAKDIREKALKVIAASDYPERAENALEWLKNTKSAGDIIDNRFDLGYSKNNALGRKFSDLRKALDWDQELEKLRPRLMLRRSSSPLEMVWCTEEIPDELHEKPSANTPPGWPDQNQLFKGATHKYIKRVPTGKPKPKYRYYYKVPGRKGLVSSEDLAQGAKFKAEHQGVKGHFEVHKHHKEKGLVSVKHDESGQMIHLKEKDLHRMMQRQLAKKTRKELNEKKVDPKEKLVLRREAKQQRLPGTKVQPKKEKPVKPSEEKEPSLKVLKAPKLKQVGMDELGKGGFDNIEGFAQNAEDLEKQAYLMNAKDREFAVIPQASGFVLASKQKQTGPVNKKRAIGEKTSVFIRGSKGKNIEGLDATYEIMDASKLIASHDPKTFSERKDYPEGVQERRYHEVEGDRNKIIRIAQELEPAMAVNTNPDAINGAPIITEDNVVLGGNGRTMGMQHAYLNYPESAEKLKRYMAQHAKAFGVSPAQVAAMKQPILVRRIKAGTDTTKLRALGRRMNEALMQGLDPRSAEVAIGKNYVNQDVVESLTHSMNPDETLSAFLRSEKSRDFLNTLKRNGVVDQFNISEFVDSDTGLLNEDGRLRVERVLAARLLPDASLLSRMGQRLRQNLAKSAVFLMNAETNKWDIKEPLATAVKVDLEMRSKGFKPNEAGRSDVMKQVEQKGFEGHISALQKDPIAQKLLEIIQDKNGPKLMLNGFKQFALEAARQQHDFGANKALFAMEPVSQDQALMNAFGLKAPKKKEPELFAASLKNFKDALAKGEVSGEGLAAYTIHAVNWELDRLMRQAIRVASIKGADINGQQVLADLRAFIVEQAHNDKQFARGMGAVPLDTKVLEGLVQAHAKANVAEISKALAKAGLELAYIKAIR